jgi:hypothetical protein
MNFLERTLSSFVNAMERALYAEELAQTNGLLQRLDPRIKVVGILALVIAVAMAHNLRVIGAVFAGAVLLAVSSRIPLASLARRAWLPVLLFTGIIALPALFVVPGREVWRLPWLGWPLTAQGLASASYLVTRVETAATFSVLLILCTLWSNVLKALRVLGVPVLFVVILGPDGVGKSTLVGRLTRAFGPCFRRQRVFHWRPMVIFPQEETGRPTTDPHDEPPRGTLGSMAALLAVFLDYWLGYLLLLRQLLARRGDGFLAFVAQHAHEALRHDPDQRTGHEERFDAHVD